MSDNTGNGNGGNSNDKGKRRNMKKGSSSGDRNGLHVVNRSKPRNSTLKELYNNKKLRTKVEMLIDEGKTYKYIVAFCQDQGLDISEASITNYKKKREEAYKTGVSLESIIDGRSKKGTMKDISNKEITEGIKNDKSHYKATPNHSTNQFGDEMDEMYDDVEFLQMIINKSAYGASQIGAVDIGLGMKAVEIKDKITGGALKGLSIRGLKEMGIRQRAREQAWMEVIQQYVPEEKWDEFLVDLEVQEEAFYEKLDLTDEGKRATKALSKLGIDI